MAEIRQARISGYLNPDLPEEDLQAKAIRKKQASMQEALGRFQISNARETQRVQGVNRKAEDWFNQNANMLYSQGSDPLELATQNFNDPAKMASLYKKYQTEVGGNFQQFQSFVDAGKGNEASNNSRKLTMMLDELGEDGPKILNKKLQAMDDGERNQLFGMLDGDTYSRLSEIYDVDKDYKLGDYWENNWKTGAAGVGAVGAAFWAFKKGKMGPLKEIFGGGIDSATLNKIANAGSFKNHVKASESAWRNLNPDASKADFAEWKAKILFGGKGEKKAKGAWKNYSDSGGVGPDSKGRKFSADEQAKRIKDLKNRNIAPKMKGNGALEIVPGQGVSSPFNPAPGKRYRMSAEEIKNEAIRNNDELRKVKRGASNVDWDSGQQGELFSKNAQEIIPQRQIQMHKAQVKTLVAQGSLTKGQEKIINDSIDELTTSGQRINKMNLAKIIGEQSGGGAILDKVANREIKGWKLFGYGIAGATMGSLTMGTIGKAVGGEKGEQVGQIAGTAVGAELAPRMLKQLQTLVKEKGSKHIMEKIIKKKGSAYLAGLMAKGALGTMFTAGTYGLGSLVTAGFLMKDVYDIYNILKEDLE
jgi:hypothetical protein